MQITQALPLLGGLSPAQFMRRHWQKKPLLVRQAVPGLRPPIARSALLGLAARDDVESRLVRHGPAGWQLRRGPLPRRSLPALGEPGWTLLVQGADLHDDAVHALLEQFRFLPDARLDDLMISYASDGGGVGPHFDSYDVFLLQAAGRRRWSIGRQRDLALQPGLPLKILQRFEPEQSFVLEPGDMLYLPPRYAHDGVAVGGDCMTCSIGLRAPAAGELAADLLARLAEMQGEAMQEDGQAAGGSTGAGSTGWIQRRYADPAQPATVTPAALPAELQAFAQAAVQAALRDPQRLALALGESLTEPKPQVWFTPGGRPEALRSVRLDRRTRMLYDARHVYINGESLRAAGRDAVLMRRLADRRALDAGDVANAGAGALECLADWCEAGWLHAE